jgi:Concanavalin A-like lectin/glucanases superfamily
MIAAALSVTAVMAQSKFVNDTLALNPLGYWRLNGNAFDLTGRGNTGSLINGVSFSGPGGGPPIGDPGAQAAVLNNTLTQYIPIPGTASSPLFVLDWNHPFSMMLWLKTSFTTSDMIPLAKEESSGNFRGSYLVISNGDNGRDPRGSGRVIFIAESTATDYIGVETTNSVNDGNWHFLVATYDGSGQPSGMHIYVDGSQANTTVYSNTLNSETIVNNVPVTIGSRDGGSEPVNGSISEVAMFGTELTAAQVRQLQTDTAGTTGIVPHFAVGGGFVTGFSVVNNGTSQANFSISFRDDFGSPISLPFTGLGTVGSITDSVVPNGTKYYEAGNGLSVLLSGSAPFSADPNITVQTLFRRFGGDNSYYEVSVPSSSGLNEFRIPFDATVLPANGAQIFTGIAIANMDPVNFAGVSCTARDSVGNVINNAIAVPALNPLGHWANYIFPALSGQRGTIDCTSNTKIGAMGLRALGPNALSSLPVITVR